MTYRPRGRMCINCENKDRNCAHLDFKTMPKIGQDKDGMIVVKCIEFKNK